MRAPEGNQPGDDCMHENARLTPRDALRWSMCPAVTRSRSEQVEYYMSTTPTSKRRDHQSPGLGSPANHTGMYR